MSDRITAFDGSGRRPSHDSGSPPAVDAWNRALADTRALQGWGDPGFRPPASTRESAGDVRPTQDRESVPGPGRGWSPPSSGPLSVLGRAFDTAPHRSEGRVPGAANLDWMVDRDTGTLNFYQRHADGGRTLARSVRVHGERVLTPDGQVVGRLRTDGGFELDRSYMGDLRMCAPLPHATHNEGTEPGAGGASPATSGDDPAAQSSGRPTGKLTGSLDGLTAVEKRFVQESLDRGHDVEIVPTGPNRTPDFKIDGALTELKTVSGVQKQTADALSSALANRIMNGRGQAENIVVDARDQPGMTEEVARRGIRRAFGADNATGGKIQTITVLTPEGVVTVRRR